jgi:hypothetical protein
MIFDHHQVALITLCGKGINQSQSPRETDDSESNFKPCKGKPNSHAWNIQWSFRSNRLPFIPTRGSVPPQATAEPYAHPMCRLYAYSATTWPYSYPLCGTYSHTLVRVRKSKLRVVGGMSTPRADRLLGLPLTIFRGMWLVLSNA